MEEPDPLKSRALDSSLWELALLKNHVQPKIAAAAKFLDANMPPVEWDFREHLDSSYAKVMLALGGGMRIPGIILFALFLNYLGSYVTS